MSFQIGSKTVGENSPCFIIAEIGQNHQGDLNLAKRMIFQAKVSLDIDNVNYLLYFTVLNILLNSNVVPMV